MFIFNVNNVSNIIIFKNINEKKEKLLVLAFHGSTIKNMFPFLLLKTKWQNSYRIEK
jgi:hypothetical protein